MEEEKSRGTIDGLKPKTAFKAGLFSGLGIMFAIGFFILLGLMLNGKDIFKGNDSNNNAANDIVNNANDDVAGEIVLKAVDKKNDWIKGNKDAKISIIEFSDIDCPYCQRHHDNMNQIIKDYGKEINWVFKHFPLPSLHPEASKKAEATECVGELGGNDKFWQFLDALYASNTETLATLPDIASGMGIDKNKFSECLNSGKYTSKVNDMSNQALAAGAQGTPYSVIVSGDIKIPINGALPLENIQAQLDFLLE